MKATLAMLMAWAFGALAWAEDGLVVFEWSGYDDPGLFQAYLEQHGEPPDFVFFGEEEEAFQKLRAGFRADLSHPCSQSVAKWYDAGLLEPIDTSRIERWQDLDEAMRNAFKFDDGNHYLVPADWGTTALTYRADLVDEADMRSSAAFIDPKFAGRVTLPDNVDDAYALALLATGRTDWSTATPADIDLASDWLRKAHLNVRTYWTDSVELAQLLSSGEALIAWAWNETPVTMQADGHDVRSNHHTIEGSSSWFCGYVNLANDAHDEARAYDFLNAWMEPDSAIHLVESSGYGHGNQVAMSGLDQDALARAGLGSIHAPVLPQVPLPHQIREVMIKEFELIKAGF